MRNLKRIAVSEVLAARKTNAITACGESQNKTQCSHARKCSQGPFDTPG